LGLSLILLDRWFSKAPLGSKRSQDDRKEFGASLLRWAGARSVMLANCLTEDIQSGFPQGDDAFDAVVGLFGMLQVCLGRRATDGRHPAFANDRVRGNARLIEKF
jgi:hypothetical protein